MARLTLQVDSPSLLEQLKNVLSLMRGVKIVSDSPVSRSAALEDVPNAETLAAMKEAESGHRLVGSEMCIRDRFKKDYKRFKNDKEFEKRLWR